MIIVCFIDSLYSGFEELRYCFWAHINELRNYSLYNTQQRKFLFSALRRFVLAAARHVVVRLVDFGDAIASQDVEMAACRWTC